jgi:hypothetical protein
MMMQKKITIDGKAIAIRFNANPPTVRLVLADGRAATLVFSNHAADAMPFQSPPAELEKVGTSWCAVYAPQTKIDHRESLGDGQPNPTHGKMVKITPRFWCEARFEDWRAGEGQGFEDKRERVVSKKTRAKIAQAKKTVVDKGDLAKIKAAVRRELKDDPSLEAACKRIVRWCAYMKEADNLLGLKHGPYFFNSTRSVRRIYKGN